MLSKMRPFCLGFNVLRYFPMDVRVNAVCIRICVSDGGG